MHIQKAVLQNIRAIDAFEMEFQPPYAGWHVLIGDNGSGKSTIIRSIALALIGKEQAFGIRPNWAEWLQKGKASGSIELVAIRNETDDVTPEVTMQVKFANTEKGITSEFASSYASAWNLSVGWFSAGYGPFRRFTGGDKSHEHIFNSPSMFRLSSHMSLFGEDVALTEATEWLMKLQYQHLEKKSTGNSLESVKKFINSPDFLPNGVQLTEVSSEGVYFSDANGAIISINQMSDGFRSVLSLTFELIRQLVRSYREEEVFEQINRNNMVIDLPGVVLIDEVDAHLHPSWQTRIGHWFLKYFPNIQFVVTSHSPLVCRASEKGSIWRLAPPGTQMPSEEVKGVERERLIFGNILDAYGTEVFGKNVSISKETNSKIKELAELNIKSMRGKISKSEEMKLQELKTILPTSTNLNTNDSALAAD